MKKHSFLLLISFLFLPFFTQAAAVLKEGRYIDAKNNFSVTIPSNWHPEKDAKGIAFSAVSPEDAGEKTRAGFNIVVQPLPIDTAQLSEADKDAIVEKAFGQVVEGFQVLDRGSNLISGQKARWVAGVFVNAGKKAQTTQYALFKDSKIYILTFIATQSRYSAHASAFDQIAKSFQFQ